MPIFRSDIGLPDNRGAKALYRFRVVRPLNGNECFCAFIVVGFANGFSATESIGCGDKCGIEAH